MRTSRRETKGKITNSQVAGEVPPPRVVGERPDPEEVLGRRSTRYVQPHRPELCR